MNMASDGAAAPESGDGVHSAAHLGDSPLLSLAPPPIRPASGVAASALLASSFSYTPFYCEENIYFLCKRLSLFGVADSGSRDLYVVFISNEEKQVPLWHQKASTRVDGLVIWDYHVICVQSRRSGAGDIHHLVWDLDSSLPFPLPLNEYVAKTFQPSLSSYFMPNRYFRVVHAPVFLRCFASDRTHMKDLTGNWISPPPTYSPIVAEDVVEQVEYPESIQLGKHSSGVSSQPYISCRRDQLTEHLTRQLSFTEGGRSTRTLSRHLAVNVEQTGKLSL